MKTKILVLAVGVISGALCVCAQQPDVELPHPYGGVSTHVDGVFVTPVPGAPFTATVMIKTEVPMPDGTTHTKFTINMIARDSSGRIHNERRRLVSDSFRGTPPLTQVHIFDPQTRMNTFYDPLTHVATQRVLPAPPREAGHGRPGAKSEDLGASELNGIETRGLRYSYTVPATISGTGKEIAVTDEYWYSDDLHMTVMIVHNDPRTGVQTVALTKVDRQEPTPDWFQIPADYKVVDVTPPGMEGAPLPGPVRR
jgi:hypothetical protein